MTPRGGQGAARDAEGQWKGHGTDGASAGMEVGQVGPPESGGRQGGRSREGNRAMRLGYVSIEGRGETDRFLAGVADRLEALGIRLAGTVQTNTRRADRAKCDMDLRVLPDGPVVRISEDRGALARGCILDHAALEQIVLDVARRLDGAAVLIVNKFGRREAEGHGLVPVITAALERGIPVLVGVNRLNLPAFLGFAGDIAQALPAEEARVIDWCLDPQVAHVGG